MSRDCASGSAQRRCTGMHYVSSVPVPADQVPRAGNGVHLQARGQRADGPILKIPLRCTVAAAAAGAAPATERQTTMLPTPVLGAPMRTAMRPTAPVTAAPAGGQQGRIGNLAAEVAEAATVAGGGGSATQWQPASGWHPLPVPVSQVQAATEVPGGPSEVATASCSFIREPCFELQCSQLRAPPPHEDGR